jgi:AraC-like DNA-binding protein
MRKLFNSVYGQSPIEYMRSVRIEYAKELLTSGEYSVTQVASLSGFNDAAYFSREFKKYFSVAPSKYGK